LATIVFGCNLVAFLVEKDLIFALEVTLGLDLLELALGDSEWSFLTLSPDYSLYNQKVIALSLLLSLLLFYLLV
jgi:hypothetical protein